MSEKSPFQKVTDDLTGGCGCACHTGSGYRTSCEHCAPVSSPHSSLDAEQIRRLSEQVTELEEQFEALREAVRKGLVYAEACESWPSTPSEKEHYRQEVESMRAALNPASEPSSGSAASTEDDLPSAATKRADLAEPTPASFEESKP